LNAGGRRPIERSRLRDRERAVRFGGAMTETERKPDTDGEGGARADGATEPASAEPTASEPLSGRSGGTPEKAASDSREQPAAEQAATAPDQAGPGESVPDAGGPVVVEEPGQAQAPAPEEPEPVQVLEAVVEPDPMEKAREEAARAREQLLRIAADFDNFRKRSRREVEDSARRAREELLRELLPVFDNLERAVLHAEQAQDPKSVAEGVRMVLKQFLDTLGKLGVRRIQTLGEPFDPNVHEAIQQIPSAEHAAGTVVAEVLPGYVCDERLVRAAMVVVAKAPPSPATDEAEPGAG
jgi:molecular chaperone GrpE